MSSRTRAAVALVVASLTTAVLATSAGAYNEDPDADQVFPSWLSAQPASPAPQFNVGSIFYEIYPVGVHRAEAHFRNVSSSTLSFDFWAPGYQRPGGNQRVTLPPYFETRLEVKDALVLRHARPGLSASPLRVYDVRVGDAAASIAPLPDATDEPAAPDEGWMPVHPLRNDTVVRRSNLMARVVEEGGRVSVVFRNPSPRDLHFRFAVPALGRDFRAGALAGESAGERVDVPAGRDASTVVYGSGTALPLPPTSRSVPLPLMRVFVADLRAGDDAGPLYAQDRSADAGWFQLATSDASSPLPHDTLLATIEPAGDGQARVRFRSRMRTPVRFRFTVTGYQRPERDNGVVTVQPGADASTTVYLDAAADSRLGVARLRVTDVAHRDDP